MIVETRDGRRLAHREAINRGASDRPLSNADIDAKYSENADRTVDSTRAAHIRAAVLDMDRHPASALGDILAQRA